MSYNEKLERMLDNKRIEEAKKAFIADKKILGIIAMNDLACGFKEGAKWMQEEFLKNLWHSYDEVPTRKNKDILQFFEDYSADSEDDYDAYFELAHTREGFTQETWENFMNIEGTPSSWLYIDDLFPKEGGGNERV